jgi:hypothetical protein
MNFPKYEEYLKNHIYTYNDSRKIFLSKTIKKIDYFSDLPKKLLD